MLRFLLLLFPLPLFAAVDYGAFASPILSALPSFGTVLLGIGASIISLCLVLYAHRAVLDFVMSQQGYERYKPPKPHYRRVGGSYYRLSSSPSGSSLKHNVSGIENYGGVSK